VLYWIKMIVERVEVRRDHRTECSASSSGSGTGRHHCSCLNQVQRHSSRCAVKGQCVRLERNWHWTGWWHAYAGYRQRQTV